MKSKDKNTTNMNIQFPNEEYERLKVIAEQLGLTLSSLVRSTLFKLLDRVDKSGDPQDFFRI